MSPYQHSRLSTRIASVAESATLAIDSKAKALKASGVDVIGFGAGEPDFPTPEFIVEAAIKAARDPKYHRYSATSGLMELKEAISDKTLRDSGLKVSPSQVLVTNGGKHAIFNAIATVVEIGDEVIIPTPCWTSYPEAVRLAGGVPVLVPTKPEGGFRLSVQELEPYITAKTKLFIHVSPSNPTGAVYDYDQTVELGRFLAESQIFVLTDEIYEHLTYDGNLAVSMPKVVEELQDRWIIVNGVAKTYAMTGWRVGWLIAAPDVVTGATNLQSHSTSNVNNIAQMAANAALRGGLEAVEMMKEAFDRRRRTIVRMLNEIPGVECRMPEGAFYAYPSLKGLLGRSFAGVRPASTSELASVILDQAKVAIVPSEAFEDSGYARFSYALSDSDLEEGITRIAKAVSESTD
ncbi:MAG: pyridoxal phosphate-dependent aminotransferase [Acidimicrobiaceae bacterium]|nr:pyridoxal phosphate-dependent aminotransferase [Acidimicrobiaceae bacterium]